MPQVTFRIDEAGKRRLDEVLFRRDKSIQEVFSSYAASIIEGHTDSPEDVLSGIRCKPENRARLAAVASWLDNGMGEVPAQFVAQIVTRVLDEWEVERESRQRQEASTEQVKPRRIK